MDTASIIHLYELYGFESVESNNKYIVFSSKFGSFRNIEIVYDCEEKEVNTAVKEYEEIKCLVNRVRFETFAELHHKLFFDFFSMENLSEKLSCKYKAFVNERQKIDEKYEYIPCPYSKNGNTGESIIDFLLDRIKMETASLTIVEAAAGYGKTCSIFELMNMIAQSSQTEFMPLFIELSKNRKAPIFKYVLLDEIDKNFSSLSSELVISEIKNGKIPLIIDGFDELLAAVREETSEQIDKEQSETMLDTIIELIENDSKAKIIITSRKTSLISSQILDNLMLKTEICPVERIVLNEPSIEDWLEDDKIAFFNKKNISLQHFANPMLLTFLRRASIEELQDADFSIKVLVENNIEALLRREMERQQLKLSPSEQDAIFIELAKYFIDFQITSEDVMVISDIFMEIIKNNLFEYMNRYDLDNDAKLSTDKFIGKLVRHVFLDTNKSQSNQIGYVNDFMFGLYMAKAVCDGLNEKIKICQSHIDKMCTAYKAMPINERLNLHNHLCPFIVGEAPEILIQIDNQLDNHLTENYTKAQLNRYIFDNFDFTTAKLSACIFSNCIFKNCIFDSKITDCQFISCQFYGNSFANDTEHLLIHDCGNFFFDCTGIANDYTGSEPAEEENIGNEFEKKVLEQFWGVGRAAPDRRKYPNTLFRGFPPSQYKYVSDAISVLKKKGLLLQSYYCIEINMKKMKEIRGILKKEGIN